MHVQVGADHEALGQHPLAVSAENGDGRRVERDAAPTARGLGLTDEHLAANLDDRLHDPEPPTFEVDVLPAQPERLTTPHACGGQYDPEWMETVVRLA